MYSNENYTSAVNEHTPAFTSSSVAATVSEAADVGDSVADMTATDDDDGDDGTSCLHTVEPTIYKL